MTDRNLWFARQIVPGASLRLFCFAHAGGGTAPYAGWAAHLPGVEVCAVRLPGRESRLAEAPFDRLAPLIDALADVLAAEIDLPFAFFGHSMGALVAFELARELRRRGTPGPRQLLLSGRRAPHIPDGDLHFHHLPVAEFIAQLRRLGGTPPEILGDPELLELFLPAIRADFCICETYVHTTQPPLACGLTILGGMTDQRTPVPYLEAWRAHTTGPFRLHLFAGGHFFLAGGRRDVLAVLADELSQVPRPGALVAHQR